MSLEQSTATAVATTSFDPVAERRREYQRFALIVGAGWLGTNLAYAIYNLPLTFLLKDQLHLTPVGLSVFFGIGHFTNYIKPLAGMFTDAVPFFGTRRRHYLIFSLAICGLLWLVFGIVPRTYSILLATYTIMYISVVFISTTLGGVMAEGGERFRASGRLSAQRIGIFRVSALFGALIGGWLATQAFGWTTGIVAGFHFALIPLMYSHLQESPISEINTRVFSEVRRQARVLISSRALWSAAGLVLLVVAAPGFATPLLYYQTDELHFSKPFIGVLGSISGASGVIGALMFGGLCRRFPLRPLLAMGVLTHVVAALFYLGYNSSTSAMVIHCLYEAAQTLAVLPLYDLAIRATPKGSEALGYSVMMSVWNLTSKLSDIIGSYLFTRGITFQSLIWINAGTTALVLLAIPFLPRSLTDRTDEA